MDESPQDKVLLGSSPQNISSGSLSLEEATKKLFAKDLDAALKPVLSYIDQAMYGSASIEM